jgi:branched-chain amino acid transport system substrate-binding protein
MKKVVKFFCIVGVVGLIFCFSNSPSLAQVKVGAMFSMTGAGSAVGKVQLDGVKLAIKQANDQGGVMLGGKKVKVEAVIRDDEIKSCLLWEVPSRM